MGNRQFPYTADECKPEDNLIVFIKMWKVHDFRPKINNLTFHLKKIFKKQKNKLHIKLKQNRRKKIIKTEQQKLMK